MSFDKNGNELSVGDVVTVECEIIQIVPGMRADNLEVVLHQPKLPVEEKLKIGVMAKYVVKTGCNHDSGQERPRVEDR